jgi:hypothetical protein
MLVDGYPAYDYSSADILPVDEISIAIAILLGAKSRANRTILFFNKAQFAKDVSNFESFIDEAIRAFEELRFQVIRNKQVCGLYSQEDLLPLDERLIAIALLNNAKIRAELSITNLWGQSMLDEGQQQTMDRASSAINAAIEILKNSRN